MIKILISIFCLFCLFIHANEPVLESEPAQDSYTEQVTSLDEATLTYESAFIKMIFALIGILILACLVFYFFKKFSSSRVQQTNHFRNIKILEKRAISPKSMLYLIEVGGKKILLGESQLELRNISQLEWLEGEKKGL